MEYLNIMSETLGSRAFYLALLTKRKNQQWKSDKGLKTDCSNLLKKMFFSGKMDVCDFVSTMRKHVKTMADYNQEC